MAALVLVAALVVVLLWRVRDEEQLLSEEFGDAWTDYTSKSWRFIPFVY